MSRVKIKYLKHRRGVDKVRRVETQIVFKFRTSRKFKWRAREFLMGMYEVNGNLNLRIQQTNKE